MPANTPVPTETKTNGKTAQERAGRQPSPRLVAGRGLFRGPNPVCPDELYVRVDRGEAVRERQRMVVQPWSTVSLDTYFGRFPASYWQRWSVVDEVTVELVVTGSGRLSVVASNAESETRVVAGEVVKGARDAEVVLTARFERFLDGGHLWLDIDTEDAELTIESLRWTVAPPAAQRPTSMVICTFNRADDCLTTLRAMAADQEALAVLDSIYVVDQGDDTVASRAGFTDVEAALHGRLRYLRQPNLGGAGGFTRGLMEVTDGRAEPADVLFMDDDVLLEPEIAIRLTAFANRTHTPTIVGGQMLRMFKPTHLVAGAEYADFAQLVPGKVVDGALDDVDLLAEELDDDEIPTGKPNRGDLRVDADYNAWWACLIPSEAVARLGYPLPLFFQWDDVEYGYRARANGIATVTLPGAGLWHQDFDSKDLDKWSEYFAVRNAMIVATLHADVNPKQTARVLTARIVRNLLSMRYGLAATLMKAVEDYLEGPKILTDGGMAAAAAIRKLRAEYPDTVVHRVADLPDVRSGKVQVVKAASTPTMVRLVLIKRLLHLILGKTTHGNGAVAAADAEWWHLGQFDNVVVTDASQDGVRLLRRDRAQMVGMAKQAAAVIRRFIAEAPRLKQEYRAAVPELTSKENWQRLYS